MMQKVFLKIIKSVCNTVLENFINKVAGLPQGQEKLKEIT